MRFLSLTLFLASLATGIVASDSNYLSYDGYKVFRVKTQRQLATIQKKLSNLRLELWETGTQGVDVVVPPEKLSKFKELGLEYSTMHEDLGASITAEAPKTFDKRQVSNSSWFDSYHNYTDHIQFFNDLQAGFPNNSEIVSAGKSVEGRDLFGIHFWGAGGPGKPVVLYHATVHAREWIAAPVVEYLSTQLIEGYKAGENVSTGFLNKYDFYVFPFVNPDGFVYTQTTNRLWRKNRQPPSVANSTCYGRDINRNWEYAWGSTPRGSSADPCSQTYRGEVPSDTPENSAYDKQLRALRDTVGIKLYIDWHSYGQYILSPYGSNETLYAPELGKWTKTAADTSDAIRVATADRTTFTFGPSGATLYNTNGAAPDHVYAIGKADFAYTIELRDTGDFGFVLPPEQIQNSVKEQWAGQQVMISYLDEVFFDGEGPAIYF